MPMPIPIDADFEKLLGQFHESHTKILDEMHKAIIGQGQALKYLLVSIFSRGHCLLVGVPGLAKTSIVSSLAQIMDLKFKRVQFTPDLMPSDITGTNVIDENQQGKREFRFMQGPLFANIVLADEINRTPPKTQAALLEAMQERQVSVGQTTYPLPNPFFVIATQNPIEQEGTYPLPEAQLDRFMFNIYIDYPTIQEEENILSLTTKGEKQPLKKIIRIEDILNAQKVVDKIAVSQYIVSYAAKLVRSSRPKSEESPSFVKELVEWGAGPRAGQYLLLGGKALAAMEGRVNVSIQDIKEMAIPVLRHRIATNFQAQAEGIDSVALIQKLLKSVTEPEVAKYV